MRERVKNTAARTDDDLMDEDAGAARADLAAASRNRKAAEQAELDAQNEAQRKRLDAVEAVVDDDITDDAAGAMRGKVDIHNFGGR
mmetsp:Transcript_56625/g.150606  ORF Transcript_56625/g.150606 Transcript_56625/m.150606 type:complete len:86 (-) Transcript_56625:426-683(-)